MHAHGIFTTYQDRLQSCHLLLLWSKSTVQMSHLIPCTFLMRWVCTIYMFIFNVVIGSLYRKGQRKTFYYADVTWQEPKHTDTFLHTLNIKCPLKITDGKVAKSLINLVSSLFLRKSNIFLFLLLSAYCSHEKYTVYKAIIFIIGVLI
jgi:hypothetical protein